MFNPIIPSIVYPKGPSCGLLPLFASRKRNGLLPNPVHTSVYCLPIRNDQLTYVPSNDVLDL
jgi:hypothetical protein